jgi:exoribonuclease-2
MTNGLVRADTLPLVFKAMGCESLPRGTRVRVALKGLDTLTLEVHAALLARLGEVAGIEAALPEPEEDEAAAPIALQLAIDVSESDAPAEATASGPAPEH